MAKLLDYLSTNPSATIQYRAGGMALYIHMDTSYFSVSKARSRASGVFFLADTVLNTQFMENYEPIMNRLVHIVCKMMKNIIASTAETELGVIFICGQDDVPVRTALIEIIHPRPSTPIQVDNSTAIGIESVQSSSTNPKQ